MNDTDVGRLRLLEAHVWCLTQYNRKLVALVLEILEHKRMIADSMQPNAAIRGGVFQISASLTTALEELCNVDDGAAAIDSYQRLTRAQSEKQARFMAGQYMQMGASALRVEPMTEAERLARVQLSRNPK